MAAHKHGDRVCEHPTKKACEAARREALGRCAELTNGGEGECRNWAVDRVNGRAVCGQHYASTMLREAEGARVSARRARLDAAIERFMRWTADHPSVWDRMPA